MNLFSEGQLMWMEKFEALTGFDALMGDYETGQKSFSECVAYNIELYEDTVVERVTILRSEAPK